MTNKEEKQQGFMELLDCALDSIQHVRNNTDYDWVRKYGNTFLSLALGKLDSAMIVNEYNQSKNISKEKLEELMEKINNLVENDFCGDMTACAFLESKEYTQEESKKMAQILGEVYSFSHQIHCKGCRNIK